MTARRPVIRCLMILTLVVVTSGCAPLLNFRLIDRRQQGYTVVLTGIEGAHWGHAGLVSGLRAGAVAGDIEVVDWTTNVPFFLLYHLRAERRNRKQAQRLADKIVRYQDEYPGRPVNLIGHSGGGGVALLTLEALPSDRQVDRVILLAAAISPGYDLRHVINKTKRGIWNYSSMTGDAPLLIAGTTVFGTIDGRHYPSAGAIGFRISPLADALDRRLYAEKLFERPYQWRMALNGNLSDHYGAMNPFFAKNELAPLLREPTVLR